MFLRFQPSRLHQYAVRVAPVLIATALLGLTAPSASARRFEVRRHPRIRAVARAFVDAALPGTGLMGTSNEVPAEGQKYELKLAHAHTNDVISVVYRVGDTYIPEALDTLNHFLRDSHNETVSAFDPRTFDVLHTMLAKVGKSSSVIDVLSAYRSQETNDALRASHTTNAAEHSQHIEAKAIDLRVEGVSAATLRDAALSVGAGGVGYYPKAQFIHVDTGDVRQWTYAAHKRGRGGRGHGRRHRRA